MNEERVETDAEHPVDDDRVTFTIPTAQGTIRLSGTLTVTPAATSDDDNEEDDDGRIAE